MTEVAVITGGAQGIGLAIARRIGLDGRTVVLVDVDAERSVEALERLREEGIQGSAYECDVSVSDQVRTTVAQILTDYEKISVLVNNAGVIRDNWIADISDEDWDLVIDVNLKGTFNMCRSVVPHLRERQSGKIVNIASRAWLGNPGQSNYSASKGGIVSLTRTLALELARFHINCNAVAPGLIDTPLVQGLPEKVRNRLIEAQPTKEMGRPEDVAAAVSFLASDEARFVTGQVLNVCGGKSVGLGI